MPMAVASSPALTPKTAMLPWGSISGFLSQVSTDITLHLRSAASEEAADLPESTRQFNPRWQYYGVFIHSELAASHVILLSPQPLPAEPPSASASVTSPPCEMT
jgi:hypothetical protein